MRIIKISKYILFCFHILFVLSTLFLPFFYNYFIYLQLITIFSWFINDNQCLLSQIEYFLYKDTLINFYYRDNKNRRFNVPFIKRFILYFIFIFNLYIQF